jgi:hypothetical protein
LMVSAAERQDASLFAGLTAKGTRPCRRLNTLSMATHPSEDALRFRFVDCKEDGDATSAHAVSIVKPKRVFCIVTP